MVVLSYDPANDSPAQWRDFRAKRGLLRSNWHFVVADSSATRRLARHLDLDFWTYHDHLPADIQQQDAKVVDDVVVVSPD